MRSVLDVEDRSPFRVSLQRTSSSDARSQSADAARTLTCAFLAADSTGVCGVDDHCHILEGDSCRPLTEGVLDQMATRGRKPAVPPPPDALIVAVSDLIGPPVHRLLHDPGIQTRRAARSPDRCRPAHRNDRQCTTPFPVLRLTFRVNRSMMSHQTTQLRDVIALMTSARALSGQPRQLFGSVKGAVHRPLAVRSHIGAASATRWPGPTQTRGPSACRPDPSERRRRRIARST